MEATFNFGQKLSVTHYGIAVGFGLIHGMGFSNFLRAMRMPGEEKSEFIKQLFAFNLGIELGQIMIVLGILTLGLLFLSVFKVSRRLWNRILSGAAIVISVFLLYQIHFAG